MTQRQYRVRADFSVTKDGTVYTRRPGRHTQR